MRLLDLLKANNLLDIISFKFTKINGLEAIQISDVEFLLFTNDEESGYCRYDVRNIKKHRYLENISVNNFIAELKKVIKNEQEKFLIKNLLLEQLKKK